MAVAKSGSALWYASEDFRADREVALAAVAHNGRALQYAAAHMRADKEVVLAAVVRERHSTCAQVEVDAADAPCTRRLVGKQVSRSAGQRVSR